MAKLENKIVRFEENCDDVIIVLMQQDKEEFILLHNNDFNCQCKFCVAIAEGILEVAENFMRGK